VACPFFLPLARLNNDQWIHAPRLPLGDVYRGECRASAEPFEPAEQEQRELCNCGYAHGRCTRFPEGAPDAARFSLIEDSKVVWIVERDHSPIEFGFDEPRDEILAAQRRAFLESHRRRLAIAAGA